MKRLIKIFSLLLIIFFLSSINVNADSKILYVKLDSLEYSTNKNDYSSITEYKTLEEFLKDYDSNNLPSIYVTDFLFDGVTSVKTPDLDDFILNDSNDTKIKTLEIKVININTIGNIEFSGEIIGAMIGVDTNNKKGDINIILNNVSLDTDSKKAPAIYVYNKDKNYTDCKVTIKTLSGTKNYIEGGKLKKVSLLESEELEKYSSYYSNDSLSNYNKYSSYYGIYAKNEIDSILFATVTADSEDLKDGDPYYYYKASGAISSDIDLYFEGEGFLSVTSKNKEGIETKGNLTFSGGTGDYEIYSQDDCLNTTTANSSTQTVRNNLTIDVNSLIAQVDSLADEGDAIDSNGQLIINGGTIYAFAHPTSQDAGLDSGNGTYINGGTVISTGNMTDQISNDSKQKYIYASFDKIDKDTLVVIKNQNDKIITAFKTNREIKSILYSSEDFDYESYKIYIGGVIDGEETNGLYTKINSYTNGEEITFKDVGINIKTSKKANSNNAILFILIVEIVLLVLSSVIYIKGINSSTINNKTNNSNFIYYIIISVLIVAFIVLWLLIINNSKTNTNNRKENSQKLNNSNINYSSVKEITKDEDITEGSFESTNKDENVISINGYVTSTISNVSIDKTGDSDGETIQAFTELILL